MTDIEVTSTQTESINVDQAEIAQFDKQATDWWDLEGPMKMLHAINPLRMAFILEMTELADKNVLDIGCGAGILTETLALHQAKVLGIDLAEEVLDSASLHAQSLPTPPNYQKISAEGLAESHPAFYDVITCMECLEHVPDPASILKACAQLLKPNGFLFLSTLNRTPTAYIQAILAAEYLLNWVPRGTHHYERFIKPHELVQAALEVGLTLKKMAGIKYHPLSKNFTLSRTVSVNYLICFQKICI